MTHLQNMSLKELQGQHSGHWLSILEKDIQKVETFLGTTMIQSVFAHCHRLEFVLFLFF